VKSSIVKRSVIIGGRKTSVSLEDEFWHALKQIAVQRYVTLSKLLAAIDSADRQGNLSSAIRLFVLDHYRARAKAVSAPRKTSREDGAVSPTA
jgi:predicted DNA-binding ribbon-helix-helix protein